MRKLLSIAEEIQQIINVYLISVKLKSPSSVRHTFIIRTCRGALKCLATAPLGDVVAKEIAVADVLSDGGHGAVAGLVHDGALRLAGNGSRGGQPGTQAVTGEEIFVRRSMKKTRPAACVAGAELGFLNRQSELPGSLQKTGELGRSLKLWDRIEFLERRGKGVGQAPHGAGLKLLVPWVKILIVYRTT